MSVSGVEFRIIVFFQTPLDLKNFIIDLFVVVCRKRDFVRSPLFHFIGIMLLVSNKKLEEPVSIGSY